MELLEDVELLVEVELLVDVELVVDVDRVVLVDEDVLVVEVPSQASPRPSPFKSSCPGSKASGQSSMPSGTPSASRSGMTPTAWMRWSSRPAPPVPPPSNQTSTVPVGAAPNVPTRRSRSRSAWCVGRLGLRLVRKRSVSGDTKSNAWTSSSKLPAPPPFTWPPAKKSE